MAAIQSICWSLDIPSLLMVKLTWLLPLSPVVDCEDQWTRRTIPSTCHTPCWPSRRWGRWPGREASPWTQRSGCATKCWAPEIHKKTRSSFLSTFLKIGQLSPQSWAPLRRPSVRGERGDTWDISVFRQNVKCFSKISLGFMWFLFLRISSMYIVQYTLYNCTLSTIYIAHWKKEEETYLVVPLYLTPRFPKVRPPLKVEETSMIRSLELFNGCHWFYISVENMNNVFFWCQKSVSTDNWKRKEIVAENWSHCLQHENAWSYVWTPKTHLINCKNKINHWFVPS